MNLLRSVQNQKKGKIYFNFFYLRLIIHFFLFMNFQQEVVIANNYKLKIYRIINNNIKKINYTILYILVFIDYEII